ncbi:MAG: pyridoxal phosphate-dependent aminotransferase [Chloroflexota bacterium]
MVDQRTAQRTRGFTESVIREMTRLIQQSQPEGGLNLAQGFPDFSAAPELKDAACEAIQGDTNQYAITWGAKEFRDAIAAKTQRTLDLVVDPETEITVCCGATEGMISVMLATLNPDDEVVIFEPFYENYGPDCILCGARPRFVTLHAPNWTFDPEALAAAFNEHTRAVILNTPNNPTGKVFSREELSCIAELCIRWDCLLFSDEIYEHIVYDGLKHVSPATLPGMRERTVVINSLSKSYSVTGWRVGYVIAPPDLTSAIRKVHDFLTVGAAAPLQMAGVVAMQFPGAYYELLLQRYAERRDIVLPALQQAGFSPSAPQGAYYVMCDISRFGFSDDVAFAHWLIEKVGVAVVPGSSFFHDPSLGRQYIRIAYPKKLKTLRRATKRLLTVQSLLSPGTRAH